MDAIARPRFRACPALVVVEQRAGGQPYFVVKHPSGRCFGLTAGSYRLLRAFEDGRSIEDVAPSLVGQAEAASADRLRRAIERLVRSGLLEPEVAAPIAPPPTRARRLIEHVKAFNPFYIRLRTVDPTRLLRRVQPILSPLFTLPALIVFLAAIGGAGWLIADNSRRFYASFFTFRAFSSWTLAYVLLCGATLLHELGHGVACRRYGGEVREMGIIIYFLQIGAYCNVTDAWLMPDRRHRIIVSLAGVYVEGFLFAIAIMVWAATAWFSPANKLAFVLAVILAMRVVLNLFPLLKLDGYFVLSDLIGVRNLRPKAFSYVLSWLPGFGRPDVERAPLARRVMLAIYGVLSLATVACIAPAVLWRLHGRIAGAGSPTAIAMFWIIFAILAPISIASLVRQLADLRKAEV
jgi:putative peptide zinc metalloprotease protein